MAHKRMFSKDITESDSFGDMPLSTQALYFHLGMNADDDGFINNAKKIQRGIGASTDDLGLLVAKGFVIPFESGVVVIKHWRINNNVRSDRYAPTKYQDEFAKLYMKENKAYSLLDYGSEQAVSQLDTSGIPLVGEAQPQDRIGEDRIEERYTLSGTEPGLCGEVVGYLNERIGTSYRPSSRKTRDLVRARANEGFGLDDFKAVIDKKASDWLGDAKMARYLRPETLFGPKFEGYLQESKAVIVNEFACYD